MDRPTWATVVGVLGIIFGLLGILGGGQLAVMPAILEFQKEMFSDLQGTVEKAQEEALKKAEEEAKAAAEEDGEGTTGEAAGESVIAPVRPGPPMPFKGPFKMFERFMNIPEWYKVWCVVGGLLSVVVSGFLIFSSIWLLQTKQSAISFMYWALGADIVLSLAKAFTSMLAFTIMGIGAIVGGLFWIALNVVLFVVIVTGDKRAFAPLEEQIEGSR